ncbi:MAG: type IV secretion protein DotH [Alphaproteobacteria bacterium]|nr:type IV secretion protein DotH [Alphaproteobacteria bacterium]
MVTTPAFAQEFVLPDFGDKSANTKMPETDKGNETEIQNEIDFFPEGSISQAGNAADDFDFEKSPEELQEELRGDAYDAALQGLLPLRPGEIRELLEQFDRTQESVELPVYPAPKPQIAVETLSLDPGTKPTTIKVAHGYVTTLNILDSTGAPWPIEDITWAGNFEVVESGNDSSHFVRISPQSEFAYGNMSIHLSALQTPIIISLETSRDIVHYRFDAIVPEAGPFAKTPIIQSGLSTAAGDTDMSGFLEGVLPPDAQRLSVSGVDGRTSAYKFNGLTYLRTPLTLLSPAWISSASSADGMRIYAMNSAPVLLLSEKGRMVRARLSEREDLLDER